MLLHRYLAFLFASAIPSSALSLRAKVSSLNYKRSNVTSVRSNNTTTNCNSNTTSTPFPIDPSSLTQHTADEVIKLLNLSSNVEGGYFRQTFEDPENVPGLNRSLSTLIYYLMVGEQGISKWHTVDATEVWHYYAGSPLVLEQVQRFGDGPVNVNHSVTPLGPRIFEGQVPQAVIPKGVWQRAFSWGDWTLVGTTVSPGFTQEGFKLAKEGCDPILENC
ncbi:hypothetical protein E4U17_003204 [Claviceps sp. LM77 group G4]|nr:hypothetical protein E4U17_003204 [Claviceps sp. LM77 group G4]KAG6056507.1 hypothetical protein E4U33_007680 [Claviceps sp. LM78 group G4]KAG6066234.1 hypothetical protein E4U16_000289 [Claviceps sp. LM84 group G4]